MTGLIGFCENYIIRLNIADMYFSGKGVRHNCNNTISTRRFNKRRSNCPTFSYYVCTGNDVIKSEGHVAALNLVTSVKHVKTIVYSIELYG